MRDLVDQMMGFTAHQRVDAVLKGDLVERATEQSYERTGQWTEEPSWRVSRQTVMKAVHSVELSPCASPPARGELRRVPYLFIQADEDHVPNQQEGPKWQPKLVTVHEEAEGPAERRRLIRPMRFGGLYPRGETEPLYEQVWKYLEATYDLEHVQAILVSGDGAPWIRRLCEYSPGTEFVLDRFHAHTGLGGDRSRGRALQRDLAGASRSGPKENALGPGQSSGAS